MDKPLSLGMGASRRWTRRHILVQYLLHNKGHGSLHLDKDPQAKCAKKDAMSNRSVDWAVLIKITF